MSSRWPGRNPWWLASSEERRDHRHGRPRNPAQPLSYLLQAGPADPAVYLTWLLRPASGECTIRLEIDEVDAADSQKDAEDVWLPVLAALQRLVNPA
jgi:hypothetical protein